MKTDKKAETVSFRSYLIDLLKDPEEALAYIEAAKDENDPELLELACRDVEEARKQVNKLPPKETQIRVQLFRRYDGTRFLTLISNSTSKRIKLQRSNQ